MNGHYEPRVISLNAETFTFYLFVTFVGLSGYLYTSYQGNILVIDFPRRAIVQALIFVAAVVCMLRWSSIRVVAPLFLLWFALFWLYIVAVAVASGGGFSALPSATRFLIYFSCFYWAFQSKQQFFMLETFTVYGAVLSLMQIPLDSFLGRGYFINQAFRYGGSVGSAIGMAGLLYVFAVLTLAFFLRTRRPIFVILYVALVLGVLATGTRSILGALIFVTIAMTVMSSRNISRKIISVIFATLLFAPFVYFVLFYSELGNRILFDSISADSSTSFRLMIIVTVLENVDLETLLFGIGLGGFPNWFANFTGIEGVAPHFEFVWLLMECGLIGITLYCMGLWYLYRLIRDTYDGDMVVWKWMLIVLFTSPLISFQLANPNYFYQCMIPVAFVLGLALRLPDTAVKLSDGGSKG